MVDYCDSSFFGVRYRAVLPEDRLQRGQNHGDIPWEAFKVSAPKS